MLKFFKTKHHKIFHSERQKHIVHNIKAINLKFIKLNKTFDVYCVVSKTKTKYELILFVKGEVCFFALKS